MVEPFFAAGPQLWSTLPVPGFGYFPPMAASRSPVNVSPRNMNAGIAMPTPADFAARISPLALLSAVAIQREQPAGPGNDQEIEEFIGDALDLLPGAHDVEVRCEAGRVTLAGTVAHKRLKRDVGEIAWAIPSANDVQNNITIVARRRSRPQGRESEAVTANVGRKQS